MHTIYLSLAHKKFEKMKNKKSWPHKEKIYLLQTWVYLLTSVISSFTHNLILASFLSVSLCFNAFSD